MLDTDSFKKNINEDYDIEEELGSGQFAVVRKIVEKETGDEFAAKYVRKKRTKASRNGMSREDIKREIEILRMVDSEKIIKVHDVYETDKEMILVMELLRGGELFDYISKKDFLTEEEAIDFTRQILLGLQHLHSRNVVHLDLKPENILLKNTRRKTIKLVDFGLARVVNENEQVREIMGTPEFVAPEVLNFDTISTATDMWALGVIAYILLSGASPFLGEDNQETFTNIIQVDYQFDEEYFAEISDEAKDFIRKLLVKHPKKRPTAHDCSRHPWVEEEVVDKKKRQRRRTTQICTFNFKRFVARKRWKMSYNKIRAMNLIAKMGIKPPPGFITEIPPMGDNTEVVEPEPEEKPSPHEKHEKHEKHKKNQSTINRKKHKQSSSPKNTVEKTDSLTLKTMDIDIGEGDSAEPEPKPEVELEPAVEEPVDYGSMTKREKRRARGQLRTHEIAKSKKEIDAKKENDSKQEYVAGQKNDVTQEQEKEKQVINGEQDLAALDVDVAAEEKPEVTVTSTMNIDHKPATKTQSAGILKKRDGKGGRIPSTEDHYYVTLNAALFQQDDAFHPSGLQPTRQHVHGILKHTQSAPPNSEVKADVSDDKPTTPEDLTKSSEDIPSNGSEDASKTTGASKFTTVVEVLSGGSGPHMDNYSVNANGMVVGLQVEKATAHASEKVAEKKPDLPKSDVKPVAKKSVPLLKESTTPAAKKPLGKTGFTPPPWQRMSSKDNLNSTTKPLQGLSKVSLKANRFLSNDKQSNPKSSTNTGPLKPSTVFGKSKDVQKEPEIKKTAVEKTNSEEQLKNLACDISLDDTPALEGTEISGSKFLADSRSKTRSDSQVRSDSQSKSRSGSMKENNVNVNASTNNNKNVDDNKQKSKFTINGSRSRSGSSQKTPTNTEKKVLNGEKEEVGIKNSGGNQDAEQETGTEDKLASSSTRSLAEVTIRPRENAGEKQEGGFDIMLTIAPPTAEAAQEPRGVSSMKTRFTSSSSSLPDPRSGLPNGKLMSLSTSDVLSHSRDTVTSHTTERHGVAQTSKYTPQRDFSKYLSSDQPKSIKVTGVPTNNPKPTPVKWQVTRNTPSSATAATPKDTVVTKDPTTAPLKTTIISKNPPQKMPLTAPTNTPQNPKTIAKSSTAPTTRATAAKTAAAKVSATVAMPKGKKSAVMPTAYIPRRSFGFSTKTGGQSEITVKSSEPDDATKLNNNEESKRWSHSSYSSDRSASPASSDELSLSNVTAENNALNSSKANEQIKNPDISRKIENNGGHGNLSPRVSPILERKWKATLVLPKESEKVPSKDRDIRISSNNAPRKNKFTNVRSMWEGK